MFLTYTINFVCQVLLDIKRKNSLVRDLVYLVTDGEVGGAVQLVVTVLNVLSVLLNYVKL